MDRPITRRLICLFAFCTLSWWCLATRGWAQFPNDASGPRTAGETAENGETQPISTVAALPTDPAAVIAIVERSPILLGEILPQVDARIREVTAKSKGKIPEAQVAAARISLTRSLLAQTIQNKMLRTSFVLEQVGSESQEARSEADAKLVARARQMFLENEVPQLMEQHDATELEELDAKLREKGASLASRRRTFVDMMLGHLYLREKVDQDPEVSLAEVVTFYRERRQDYFIEERARWEQLSVHFDRVAGSDAAETMIADMGREAYFGGSMEAVARKRSHGPLASGGGVHDWTSRHSLASEKLDDAIFTIPLNKMSEIIRDDRGLHIIRVLDRETAHYRPLSEVQDEISKQIKKEKVMASQQDALESMSRRVAVWSLYPDDVPGAKPLPMSIASGNRQMMAR